MSTFFAGLDWASQIHVVCIIDEQGEVQERLDVAHDAAGLASLLQRLKHWGRPPIAIERPSGLVVDTLVEAGLTVVPIHPNAVKATRPRYRSHGAKSDASDAYLLADLLRTDGHRFKPLAPQSDEIHALRALVRGRDDLVATRVQLANQLRSLLDSFWPGAAAVFADIDSPIALAFIERYSTPESAARLGTKRMAAFCAQHAYCGRRSADELLERLHRAPAAVCAELEMEAKGELARCCAHPGALGRADQAPVELHRTSGRCTRRRPHPDELPARRPHLRRPDPRRTGQRPRTLRHRRPARRRGRRRPRDLSIRQGQGRHLPMGLQPSPASCPHLPGRQLATRQRLGCSPLHQRPSQRLRPSARRSHPRQSLAARHLARLDRSQTLQPHQPSRRSTGPQ